MLRIPVVGRERYCAALRKREQGSLEAMVIIMSNDEPHTVDGRDPRLLPGISALMWGRIAALIGLLAVVVIASLALADPGAPGAAWVGRLSFSQSSSRSR